MKKLSISEFSTKVLRMNLTKFQLKFLEDMSSGNVKMITVPRGSFKNTSKEILTIYTAAYTPSKYPVPDNDYGYICTGKHRSHYEAWLDPEGNWYNMHKLGDHTAFAYHVVKSRLPDTDDIFYSITRMFETAPEILLQEGWIKILSWFCGDIILRGYEHMNRKQYKVLLEVLGETKLFRGWTVRSLWLCKKEAKKQAKEDY